jgi:predicted aldo/keto reductase-like oxidoreductase
MKPKNITRRQFLEHSAAAAAAGALALAPTAFGASATATPVRRTATDQVTLGGTGLKLSRLGFGTGSASGHVQVELGHEKFNSLIHYAYDQGITFFDTSQTYATFTWMAEALKGIPREKYFLQSKIPGQPEQILDVIDHHRKVFNTDYVDSMLIHCMIKENWTDSWKRIMDGFNEAHDRKWIMSKGTSCHSLPALRAAVETDWTQVHLVRVNPQGKHTDGVEQEVWNLSDHDITPVLAELKNMKAKGRGVIGMKICGNGEFVKAEDREKSIRFAMARPEIDAVVIGFKNPAEIDEAIRRINSALAETA